MIYFFSQNNFNIKKKKKIGYWILNTIKKENYKVKYINIIFCSDKYLLTLNNKFLKHNYYTDIITFDYSNNQMIQGELYLSIDRIYSNSRLFKISFSKELHRIIIHGVLHLCGYQDKSIEKRKIMTYKENLYLNNLYNINKYLYISLSIIILVF